MKRTLGIVLAIAVGTALFGALVYGVLIVAHVSEPASTTVEGLTPRRLWATMSALLALAGVVVGGLELTRSARRIGSRSSYTGTIVAVMAGFVAIASGALNLGLADGGPGTGNGVVGGAAAIVLGLLAVVLSGLAWTRLGRTA